MEKSLELIERTKLSYLRNAGNILFIQEELGLPIEEVNELVQKFRKQEDEEVAVLISNTLMRHILSGSATRKLNLHTMLKSLESTEKPILSVCCNSPVRSIIESGPTQGQYECLKCFVTNARVTNVPKATIYNIKLSIIEQLREEDIMLVEMADKMGYTNKTEGPTTLVKQNILVIEGDNKTPDGLNPEIVSDYKKMHPMDREKLIEKLKREILNFNELPSSPPTPN